MTSKTGKLAALRTLGDFLRELEELRRHRIKAGGKPAVVDRETAQIALTAVSDFLSDQDMEVAPLTRLLSDLAALSEGASPSAMLRPAATRHRRPTAPSVEAIKGRLAAIVESRQQSGATRDQALQWVLRNTPITMQRKLGLKSPSTLDAWLVKWGGKRGAARGHGREGYLHMRAILCSRRIPDVMLKQIIGSLEHSLPA